MDYKSWLDYFYAEKRWRLLAWKSQQTFKNQIWNRKQYMTYNPMIVSIGKRIIGISMCDGDSISSGRAYSSIEF